MHFKCPTCDRRCDIPELVDLIFAFVGERCHSEAAKTNSSPDSRVHLPALDFNFSASAPQLQSTHADIDATMGSRHQEKYRICTSIPERWDQVPSHMRRSGCSDRFNGSVVTRRSSFLDNGNFSDITVTCGKATFPAHKLILAQSDRLAEAFQESIKHSALWKLNREENTIELKFELEIVEQILDYLYGRALDLETQLWELTGGGPDPKHVRKRKRGYLRLAKLLIAATHLGLLQFDGWVRRAWLVQFYEEFGGLGLYMQFDQPEDLAKGIHLLYKGDMVVVDKNLEEAILEYVIHERHPCGGFHSEMRPKRISDFLIACGWALSNDVLKTEFEFREERSEYPQDEAKFQGRCPHCSWRCKWSSWPHGISSGQEKCPFCLIESHPVEFAVQLMYERDRNNYDSQDKSTPSSPKLNTG